MTARRQNLNLQKSLQGLEKTLAAAIKEAIEKASFSIDEKALIAAIDSLDFAEILNLTRINPAVMFPIDEAIRGGFIQGGGLVAGDLAAGLAGTYSFNGRHPEAEAWIRENGGRLIDGITDESLQSVRTIVEQGISSGRSSSSLAREITGRKVGSRRVGGILGLNSEQTKHLTSARSILSDPTRIREYFIKDSETGRWKPRYKLSDRRFDRQIREAIRDGRALSGKTLDDAMAAHRSKALGYRGRVIAKDQSFRALAAGRAMGYDQLLQDPNVEKVTVRWQHNLSTNPREDHVAMNGTIIDLGETFQFDDAAMKHPHDPAGGAKHSIGCRCVAIYRVVMKRDNPATAPNPAPQSPTPAPAPRLPPIPPLPRRAAPKPPTPAIEPQPTPTTAGRFAYEDFSGVKSASEAEDYLRNNGVTEVASLHGLSPVGLSKAVGAAHEVTERFNLEPLKFMGPISRDKRYRFRTPKNANAAVYSVQSAMHIPTKFGDIRDAERQIEKKNGFAEAYVKKRDEIIGAKPDAVSADVKQLLPQLNAGDYTWSITMADGASERAKTMFHEYGHVIHKIDKTIGPQIDKFLIEERPLRNGWQYLLSVYGGSNTAEYIAETFALYMTKPVSEHYRIHPKLLAIYKKADRKNDAT